jgi:hypothetical protein
MSSPDIAAPIAFPPARAARSLLSGSLWPAALLIAAAAAIQACSNTSTDVSWLTTLCEKTLDGERPYVDFIESNPPAAFLIYMPGVLAARLFGLRPEFTVALSGFLLIGASLALSATILARTEAATKLNGAGVAIAVFVLAILPARVFDQREHFAAVAGLPLLAAIVVRATPARTTRTLQILAGLGGAAMASIKPHFALIVFAALPYLAWRIGFRRALGAVELWAGLAFAVAYALVSMLVFPEYFERVVPLALAAYAPVREPFLAMLGGEGFIAWLLPAIYLVVLFRGDLARPIVAVPALGSLGAIGAFLIQGKGWPYQSYPALALIFLALGFAMAAARPQPRAWLSLSCFLAVVLVARFAPSVLGDLPEASILSCVFFLATRALAERSAALSARVGALSAPAIALTLGFAFVWCAHQNESPPLQAVAEKLASHPKIVAITQDIGVGHPFTRQVGGVWAQRVPSLWITSGVRALLKEAKDPAVVARLDALARLDHDMLVEDIQRNRPDVILISNRFGEFHDWAFGDPALAAELANYRLAASDNNPRGATELYARSDLLGDAAGVRALAPSTEGSP